MCVLLIWSDQVNRGYNSQNQNCRITFKTSEHPLDFSENTDLKPFSQIFLEITSTIFRWGCFYGIHSANLVKHITEASV